VPQRARSAPSKTKSDVRGAARCCVGLVRNRPLVSGRALSMAGFCNRERVASGGQAARRQTRCRQQLGGPATPAYPGAFGTPGGDGRDGQARRACIACTSAPLMNNPGYLRAHGPVQLQHRSCFRHSHFGVTRPTRHPGQQYRRTGDQQIRPIFRRRLGQDATAQLYGLLCAHRLRSLHPMQYYHARRST